MFSNNPAPLDLVQSNFTVMRSSHEKQLKRKKNLAYCPRGLTQVAKGGGFVTEVTSSSSTPHKSKSGI